MRKEFLRPWHGVVWPVACLVVFTGCGGGGSATSANMPKTYSVKGKVLSAQGQPLAEASIQFQLQDSSRDVTVIGNSQADGTYEMETLTSDGKAKGAPEGMYTVMVTPPNPYKKPEEQHLAPPTVMLPQPFTVKAQDNNELNIDLSQAQPVEVE